MRVYYTPPETYYDEEEQKELPFPPFEFERSQFVKCFESPHRYFKKVEIKYPIGMIIDRRTGQPKLNAKREPVMSYGHRWVWQLDEEKNAKLDAGIIPKPKNWLDLSRGELQFLNQQNQYIKFREHLVPEDKILKDNELELETVKRKHYEKMEALAKAQEAEQLKLKALIAETKREREQYELETKTRPVATKGK